MIELDATTRAQHFWYVACDDCLSGETRIETSGFLGVVAAIKNNGWQVQQRAGEWFHLCPDCVAAADSAREPGALL